MKRREFIKGAGLPRAVPHGTGRGARKAPQFRWKLQSAQPGRHAAYDAAQQVRRRTSSKMSGGRLRSRC